MDPKPDEKIYWRTQNIDPGMKTDKKTDKRLGQRASNTTDQTRTLLPPLTAEDYDKIHNLTSIPTTSKQHKPQTDSPSARPPTSTLTRDVPEQSDEPLAAVDVGCPLYLASTFLHISPQKQPNSTLIFTNPGSWESNCTEDVTTNTTCSICWRGEGERVVTSPLPNLGVDVWGDLNEACHERLAFSPSSWNPVELSNTTFGPDSNRN